MGYTGHIFIFNHNNFRHGRSRFNNFYPSAFRLIKEILRQFDQFERHATSTSIIQTGITCYGLMVCGMFKSITWNVNMVNFGCVFLDMVNFRVSKILKYAYHKKNTEIFEREKFEDLCQVTPPSEHHYRRIFQGVKTCIS